MIAQHPHKPNIVLASLHASYVASVASKAVNNAMGRCGLKRRGWMVEMTLSCDAWMPVLLKMFVHG